MKGASEVPRNAEMDGSMMFLEVLFINESIVTGTYGQGTERSVEVEEEF